MNRGYQRRHPRWAWNAKAATAANKKPVCKHRSLSTPPLPGACAARHSQGPVIQGQLPGENARCVSGWCNITLVSAAAGLHHTLYPSLPPAWVSQSPQISCSFNPVLSGLGTDALRRPTRRGGAKSKAEPQELWEQRRETEISPSSLRSSRLNAQSTWCTLHLWNTWIDNEFPKIEMVDFGSNYRLGVCFLHLICFWFYVYLSLVFRAHYHW